MTEIHTIVCISLSITEIRIRLWECVEYTIFIHPVRHIKNKKTTKFDNYCFKSQPENVFGAWPWEIELRAILECWLQSMISLFILLLKPSPTS